MTLDISLKEFQVKIEQTQASRLSQVDFDNLAFGREFSDHMFICEYKDGQWQEPIIKPYGPLNLSPSLHSLHYGQAIFEGMKAYRDSKDSEKVFMFRPEENHKRFNHSAKRLAMPEVPQDLFINGIKELVKLDRNWIPRAEGNSLYVRPFMFASSEKIMATPAEEYLFVVITSPSASYYSGAVKLKVEQHYTRAAQGGTGNAKAAGNYAASFRPMQLAKEEGYMQLLWTDAKQHAFAEEVGTMNFFIRKGDVLYTPPTSDSILSGITRKSLIELIPSLGMEVVVEKISISELEEGIKNGEVTEIFGAGTAAVISPIETIGINGIDYTLPLDKDNSYWSKLKNALTSIQFGKTEDKFGWREQII